MLISPFSGAGLMIHSRGANASDAEVVWSQLLQGIGGGFAAISSQVLAQASVKHDDLATITAAVLLCAEIGGAIGSAIGECFFLNIPCDVQCADEFSSVKLDLFGLH